MKGVRCATPPPPSGEFKFTHKLVHCVLDEISCVLPLKVDLRFAHSLVVFNDVCLISYYY